MHIEHKLTIPTKPFVFDGTVDTNEIAKDLLSTILDTNYVGVAANECGYDYRAIALKAAESFVCFNPLIVYKSDETTVMEEVSPTFPGITCKVRRHNQIRVRFTGPNGEVYSKTFTGLTARIFQQLVDNLDGTPFYNRANRFHREKSLKLRKANR